MVRFSADATALARLVGVDAIFEQVIEPLRSRPMPMGTSPRGADLQHALDLVEQLDGRRPSRSTC